MPHQGVNAQSYMRGFVGIATLLVLSSISVADSWRLTAPYDIKAKVTWAVTIKATIAGQEIESKMNQFLAIERKTEAQFVAKAGWSDVSVNGNSSPQDPPTWEVILNANGAIKAVEGGADFVRQLAPTTFVYPDKDVEPGIKWSATIKPNADSKGILAEYEVLEETKLLGIEVLKIRGKLREDNGLQSDGFYWLARDGRVMQFDFDVKNWPIAGAGMPPVEAKLKGQITK